MAGIIITGDTHGEVRRLNNKNVRKANEGEVPDFVIIAGDFGLIWSQDPSDPAERHWFKWLDEKPWETIVVAGNHENYERIFHLPREEHLGAPMYRASKRVWIAQHGNVYQIGGRRVFMFGGALSIDKAMRQDRVTYWQEEIPTQEDLERGLDSLRSMDGQVDYVVTHTAPREVLNVLDEHRLIETFADEERSWDNAPGKLLDPTVSMLMKLRDAVRKDILRTWYCGHFHCNLDVVGPSSGIRYHVLYEDLVKLG